MFTTMQTFAEKSSTSLKRDIKKMYNQAVL